MSRETKELITPIGQNKVVIKTWLTGREKREIQSVFIDDMNFKGGEYEISGSKVTLAQDKTLQTVIVSIDGDTKNILDKLLDMRSEDFDFVVNEINKITNPPVEEIKK